MCRDKTLTFRHGEKKPFLPVGSASQRFAALHAIRNRRNRKPWRRFQQLQGQCEQNKRERVHDQGRCCRDSGSKAKRRSRTPPLNRSAPLCSYALANVTSKVRARRIISLASYPCKIQSKIFEDYVRTPPTKHFLPTAFRSRLVTILPEPA